MKVVVFGATGMVGHGVLLEALDAADVDEVVAVVRRSTLRAHPKLREVLHSDFADFSAQPADVFAGAAACFYCLGVSSFRMSEADYARRCAGPARPTARRGVHVRHRRRHRLHRCWHCDVGAGEGAGGERAVGADGVVVDVSAGRDRRRGWRGVGHTMVGAPVHAVVR